MTQQKKLQSRVCEILEIDRPIVLAGMGGASSPALAAAVSKRRWHWGYLEPQPAVPDNCRSGFAKPAR